MHVALLGLVVVGLSGVVGWRGVITADEGAMYAQLDLLDSTGRWTAPNPEPALDPELVALPFENAERTADGRWAPFVKHPAHIALLWPIYAVAGELGVVTVSMAATVLAALAAAVLAARVDPRASVPALWITGVGCSLLFYSYVVLGHALGAALFGAGVLGALVAADDHVAGARRAAAAALALLGAAGAVLVRSEALLAALALAAGLVLAAARRRAWAPVGAAVAVGGAGLTARLVEPQIIEAALGSAPVGSIAFGDVNPGGFLEERWSAFEVTVLRPAYLVDGPDLALVLGVALLGIAGWYGSRRDDRGVERLLILAGAACALARLAEWASLVPGLLAAFPLLVVAVAVVRRETVEVPDVLTSVTAWAGFCVAVVLTEYAVGGNGEWGGRYFVVGLVLVTPAVALAVGGFADSRPPPTAALWRRTLVVVPLALAALALSSAARARDGAERIAVAVDESRRASADGMVVTTHGAVARFAWDETAHGRWLSVHPASLADVQRRLVASDVSEFVLVTRVPDRDLAVVGEQWTTTSSEPLPGWTIAVVRRR